MKQTLAAALLLISTSSAMSQDAFLTASQIKKSFTGRTITGSEDGSRYSEKLRADGTIDGQSSAEPRYEGEWEISGNEICFYYDDDNDDDDCSRVIIQGHTVTFVDDDGSRSTATIK